MREMSSSSRLHQTQTNTDWTCRIWPNHLQTIPNKDRETWHAKQTSVFVGECFVPQRVTGFTHFWGHSLRIYHQGLHYIVRFSSIFVPQVYVHAVHSRNQVYRVWQETCCGWQYPNRAQQICILQGPQADTVNGLLIHYALVNREVFASMPLLQRVRYKSDNVSKVLQNPNDKIVFSCNPHESLPSSSWKLQHQERAWFRPH